MFVMYGYVVGENIEEVIKQMNAVFGEICGWSNLNKLGIHSGKSDAMIIQKNRFIGSLDYPSNLKISLF